jgi:hypothetical protein
MILLHCRSGGSVVLQQISSIMGLCIAGRGLSEDDD